MKNRDIAEKIYEDLNKRGAGLGNASISIIESSLDNLDKTENTPNDLTDDKLEIYSPIDNDFYEVDSFEDAEKFIKENYIEDGDIHPDVESVVIFQKVGFVYVEDLDNGNCRVSVVQEPKSLKLQGANKKEILGDRKIVELEHDKTVLKAELKAKDVMLEKMVKLFDIIPSANFITLAKYLTVMDKQKGYTNTDVQDDLLKFADLQKELLTQYKQGNDTIR